MYNILELLRGALYTSKGSDVTVNGLNWPSI